MGATVMSLPLGAAGQALRWRWLSPNGVQAFAATATATPAWSRPGVSLLAPAHRSTSKVAVGPTSSAPTRPRDSSTGLCSVGGQDCSCDDAGGFLAPGGAARRGHAARRSVAAGAVATSVLTYAPAATRTRTKRNTPPSPPDEEHSEGLSPQLDSARAAPTTRTPAKRGRPRAPTASTPSASAASASSIAGAALIPSKPKPSSSGNIPITNPTPLPALTMLTRGGTVVRAPLLRSVPSPQAARRVTAAARGTGGYAATAGLSTAVTGAAAATTAPAAALPTRHIVAAVDPDLSGALAVVYWDEEPAAPAAPAGPAAAATTASEARAGEASLPAAASEAAAPPPSPAATTGARSQAGTGTSNGARAAQRGAARATAARNEAEGEDAEADAADEGEAAREEGEGEGGLWLPAPPAPPLDRSRWVIGVWDMPVSAAERQKPTATGGVSRRRLLHVAGARAVLASALRFALPPRGSPLRVALYGYVEVPPILPGDGNIAAYTSLWSTGAWLGLLAGMGFTVGSTPVRRWKTDLGLFGARSKDAGLALARQLFPEQCRILKHKKNHGRADALLIAAWALGASLPPRLAGTLRRGRMTVDELLAQHPGVGLAWGEPRPPAPTDAYGNLLTPEQDMMDEIEAAQSKVDRMDAERAAAAERRLAQRNGAGKRGRKKAAGAVAEDALAVPDDRDDAGGAGSGADGLTVSGRGRKAAGDASGAAAKRGRKGKEVTAADVVSDMGSSAAVQESGSGKRSGAPRPRRRSAPPANGAEAADAEPTVTRTAKPEGNTGDLTSPLAISTADAPKRTRRKRVVTEEGTTTAEGPKADGQKGRRASSKRELAGSQEP